MKKLLVNNYFILSLAILSLFLIAFSIYNIYQNNLEITKFSQDLEKFNGFQKIENSDYYRSLLNNLLEQNLDSKLQSFNAKFNKELASSIKQTTEVSEGKWIRFNGADGMSINLSKLDELTKKITNSNITSTNSISRTSTNSTISNSKSKKTDVKNEDISPISTKNVFADQDKYIAYQLFKEVIGSCKENKCIDYSSYNKTMSMLLLKNPETDNVGIGKVFLAVEDEQLYFFPNFNGIFGETLDISGRTWWESANKINAGKNTEFFIEKDELEKLKTNSKNLLAAGLTKPYVDIADLNNNTDLTRTIWVKFNAFGERKYIFGIDLRLNLGIYKTVDKKWYEIISWYQLLPLLFSLPLLAFAIIFKIREGNPYLIPGGSQRLYKLKRIDRQKVTYKAGQTNNTYKVFHSIAIRDSEENRSKVQASVIFSPPSLKVEGEKSKTKSNVKEETFRTDLTKEIDLNLKTTNLKNFELWKVCRPDNENYVLGLIEVLWQNRKNDNEITFTDSFWDSNTSAPYTDIIKSLKRHLNTNENDSFIFDQSSPLETESDIVGILREKLVYVKDLANKSESFTNRVVLFDDNSSIMKNLYSTDCKVFATCGVEFLRKLKGKDEIEEILNLPVEVRYIIDSENKEFIDFYNDLNDEQKDFIRTLPNLQIVKYRESKDTIYQNRDFCLVNYKNASCVIFSDMNDSEMRKGWISWRQPDIDYYNAIKDFIESDAEKSNVSNYLGIS